MSTVLGTMISQIDWRDRLKAIADIIQNCKFSVDGTDFKIRKLTPFSSK